MALNINNKLTTFAQQELVLARSAVEREKINGSLSHLEKVIKERLAGQISEIVRFGSYTRNTILPRKFDPYSDVDLLVVFNTMNTHYTPGTYRTKLKQLIERAYPNSYSKKDFPVVKLELNHIMFDLVPAYKKYNSWSMKYDYYIPGEGDTWRQTVPKDIDPLLSEKNQSYGDNVVRNVIRLCKHWNAGANYPFQSYEMEKWILNRFFFHGDNLYDKFRSILWDRSPNLPGTRQALGQINQYRGGIFNTPNVEKELQWLQKLLPGLK